jgi:ABC-type lipoprotein export system ATPase subunit
MDKIYELLESTLLKQVIMQYPAVIDFLRNFRIEHLDESKNLFEALEAVDPVIFEEFGVKHEKIIDELCLFIYNITGKGKTPRVIKKITICGGYDKNGRMENVKFDVFPGDVLSIVGPTGSGKSRLLDDIECMAQKDTPSQRSVFINDHELSDEERLAANGSLVAQLSQNMNFVMDCTVREFLSIHATSRRVPDMENCIARCCLWANRLSGEEFSVDTKITQLSGGQSRALMISDIAYISTSPVILIDEIENAGIDRLSAVNLLMQEGKIIIMSTHDPLLALTASKRIIMKNGGIAGVRETTPEEKSSLEFIRSLDAQLQRFRERLRDGSEIIMEEMEIKHNVENV